MTTHDSPGTAVLDLDGTLVDSAYVHALAWQAAFRDIGVPVGAHVVHRLIGMGGDRLVTAAAGEDVETQHGDEARSRHQERLDELFDRIVPTEGAVELLQTLHDHGYRVVLASSGGQEQTDRLLGLLDGAGDLLDAVLTGSDAEHSKPSGELITKALETSGGPETGVLIGDAVWDVKAATDAGVPCIGVLTGGFSSAELMDAGAAAVHKSAAALAAHLREQGQLL